MFVNEYGTHIATTRLRARASKGQRAYGEMPRNRGKNLTLIASMTLEGMGGPVAIESATDSEVFEAYVKRLLAPSLKEGQVVIMDNLPAHKTQRVRELIEEREARLRLLPSYSPDLNPIEEAFSKIKTLLSKVEARMHEALLEATAEALSAVTSEDAAGWFAHGGYGFEAQGL